MPLMHGDRVSWTDPYNHYRYGCRIIAVNWQARTVDLEFEDGGTRGSIPMNEIQEPAPELEARLLSGSRLTPPGIESQEGMGKF
jgi:hypothetical protein